MKKKYAQVIIDIDLHHNSRLYTYLIPDEMTLKPGMTVLVPFRKKQTIGYVIGILSDLSLDSSSKKERDLFGEIKSDYSLKSISRVYEDEIWINEELLSLARWMSDYYMSSLSSVLKCIFPCGIRRKKTFQITLHPKAEKFSGNIKSKDLLKVFRSLIKYKNSLALSELAEVTKIPMEKLKENLKSLKDMGLVKVDEDFLPPRARPKVIQVVNLNIEREELFRTIEKLEKSAPKQSCLLKFLIDHNSKFTMTELSKKSDISLSTIRSLREKGYIILKDVEIRRNPLTGNRNFGEHNFTLTQEQQKAFNSISQAINLRKHEVFLLHGITGSGKTEVYLQSISRALELERQAIMLVPEISLTPQTIERFYSRFGDKIALLHSKLSEGERYDEWRRLRDGKASIAIGTRSALFAPLPSVGLIVIDEEHETSYKQESMPPYHAREVSIKRAELNNAVLILGSATPSVEIFYRARQNKISLFSLPFRVEKRNLPSVEVVNMSEELKEGNKTIFSYSLQRSLWECLEKNEKILLFLNRRGHSSFVLCRDCGFVVKCQFCAVSLNYHSDRGTLSCHYCNNQIKLPSFCPNCKSRRIKYFGVGTQKVEMEVNKFFPQARTIRMDSDTTVKKGSHRALLDRFLKEDKTILIGTQMIAKGLDFPEVTLVGIITADTAINLPDFRAGERTFQILTQVSGRAGRGDVPGRVILQTYAPEHPSILAARNHDYKSFYEKEIIERKELSYPPFETIIRVLFTGKDERTVRMTGEELAGSLKDMFTSARGMVLGPCEAPIGKIRENYRWHFILKGEDISYLRNSLRDALNKISINSAVRMSIDVDPLGMM